MNSLWQMEQGGSLTLLFVLSLTYLCLVLHSVVLTARDQRSRDGWVTDIQKAISTSQARLGVARHLMGRGSILALKASPDTSTDSADSLPGQVQVTKPSSDDEPEDKTAAPVRRRLQSLKLNSRQDYQHREPVMDLALE